jgi:alpha-beta hydrolase superfamily lysophospholipase
MKKEQGYFDELSQGNIYYQYWQPDLTAKAVVVLVHGAGEHCLRYEHIAAFLTEQGFAVASFDLPGHGRSYGTPGFINSFDDYLTVLRSFHTKVVTDFPAVPKVLLGHSMGGLICANYLLNYQQNFIGCALSGPAIKTELQPGFLKALLIKLLAVITPKLGVLQLDASGVSRDPVVVKKYQDDPFVFHGKMSARQLRELFRGMNRIQLSAQHITIPMLLMHGSADVMTAPNGSVFLHEQIHSELNYLKIYEGLYHEIFNEPEQATVLGDLLLWLEERVSSC